MGRGGGFGDGNFGRGKCPVFHHGNYSSRVGGVERSDGARPPCLTGGFGGGRGGGYGGDGYNGYGGDGERSQTLGSAGGSAGVAENGGGVRAAGVW